MFHVYVEMNPENFLHGVVINGSFKKQKKKQKQKQKLFLLLKSYTFFVTKIKSICQSNSLVMLIYHMHSIQ